MDYGTIVTQEFIPRMQAALDGIRTTLIASGVLANKITVESPDTIDLRYILTAVKGSTTITAYIELTDSSHLGRPPEGKAIFTFYMQGPNGEITTSYSPGGVVSYTDDAGLQVLLDKLSQVELVAVPEATVKAKIALGV